MDKKNTSLGILFVIAAIACLYVSSRYSPKQPTPEAVRQAAAQQMTPQSGAPSLSSPGSQAAFAAATRDHDGASITTLENDFVQVHFTNFGGAIRDVALRKYPVSLDDRSPFVFNELHADPMLALADFPGLDRSTAFELVSKTGTEVVYRAVLDGRLEVTRRYVLPPNAGPTTDPYQLRAETTFHNLTSQTVQPMRVSLALGTAPVNIADNGLMLTTGYSNGKSQNFIARAKLEESGGFFGVGAHGAPPFIESPGPVVWASVGNQFFTAILTPDQPGTSLITRRVKVFSRLPDTDRSAYGVADIAQFDVPALAPSGQTTFGANFYVGPKEYRRLANSDVFKADQDKVMQFGTFKFFSQILLTLMIWIHSFGLNWGLAIVCTTLALKIIFVPLTLAASRSAKRMQKLQPQLKAINEKHKDNPQKKNTATMELFKEHKVNPMGGCLPLLITFPFFFGFFAMLRSTAELRFAPFLWAHDLSAPDTVGHIFNVPINILPILLGITSFMQMRLTPQPTVDNAQAKMMMFTPVIFLVICYNYSCALALYSTTNGIFTIVQQLIINRSRDDGEPATAKTPGGKPTGGKVVKNVTPGRRR